MRFHVPLLPLVVDIRSRPLPRFRFRLRALILVVTGFAIFFSLVVYLDRVNRGYGYHALEANRHIREANRLLRRGQEKLALPEASLQRWHSQMANEYLVARTWLGAGTGLIAIAAIVLVLVATIGRVLNLTVPPLGSTPHDERR